MAEGGGENESTTLLETFDRAAAHAKNLVGKMETSQLLQLYAYFKQAKEGPCTLPKPWWYEVQAKQKWEAWSTLQNMDQETAMKHYIGIITDLDPHWAEGSSEEGNSIKTNNSWMAVSSMANTDDFIADDDKTIFDWVKEGNVDKVLEYARNSTATFINMPDPDGMGLIHWAADRGNLTLLECLVGDLKADVNLTDKDGQTALHYAASCGHPKIVDYLLDHGANPNTPDSDGLLPVDVAADAELEKALRI